MFCYRKQGGNVLRFALSAIRGDILERERGREREREIHTIWSGKHQKDHPIGQGCG